MTTDRFTLHAAVYLILEREGRVLLSRRFNTGWKDGSYSMVAGHLDGGESISAAMAREAKEEAGITIAPEALRVVHVMHRKSGREYIDFFFIADSWEGDIRIMEPDKCDDLSWFPLDALPENTLSYIREALAHYRADVPFSESGWTAEEI